MKILKISAGLTPKRKGGVPAYVMELRDELSRRGHEIIYLDTCNQDDSQQARITQTSVSPSEFAFFNSGIRLPWEGPRGAPLSDIRASRQVEQCVLEFIGRQKPDLIHFHEVLCFPMELVSKLRSLGHKQVFTAHDYFTVCPTIQLLRHDLKVCTLRTDELQCHRCVGGLPNARRSPFEGWTRRVIGKLPASWRLVPKWLSRADSVCGRVIGWGVHRAGAYRTRRRAALAHLRSFDAILCISKAQRDLFGKVAGELPNVRQLYLSRTTYGSPCQTALSRNGHDPIRFVSLNLTQTSKGRELLLGEFAGLHTETKAVELNIYGGARVDQPGVIFHEGYASTDLESILALVDVGVIPSIWAETYGYVGPEMLTRGVPLIVSSTGAMKEYVVPGFNGLVFDPDKPGSLKNAMKSLAADRSLLARLKANAPNSKEGLISFSNHVDEMEAVYREFAVV